MVQICNRNCKGNICYYRLYRVYGSGRGDDDRDYYVVYDDDMRIININDMEEDDGAVLGKPSFQIGDIVNVTDAPDRM